MPSKSYVDWSDDVDPPVLQFVQELFVNFFLFLCLCLGMCYDQSTFLAPTSSYFVHSDLFLVLNLCQLIFNIFFVRTFFIDFELFVNDLLFVK